MNLPINGNDQSIKGFSKATDSVDIQHFIAEENFFLYTTIGTIRNVRVCTRCLSRDSKAISLSANWREQLCKRFILKISVGL